MTTDDLLKKRAPFPLECLPRNLVEEAQVLAGRGGLPVEVVAWSMLTLFSGAIGHHVHVATTMGNRSLALQTMILAPVHQEAPEILRQIVLSYAECIQSLGANAANLAPGLKTEEQEEQAMAMSPATKRLAKEATRKARALVALKLISSSMELDEVQQCVGQSFDHAVLVFGVGNEPQWQNPENAQRGIDWFYNSCRGKLCFGENTSASLSLLAMQPAKQVESWCCESGFAPPWTLLDGRHGCFGAPALGEKPSLSELNRLLTLFLTKRVRKEPRIVHPAPQALEHLNRVLADLQNARTGNDGNGDAWLAPAVTLFHRVAALLSLLDNAETTTVGIEHCEKAARMMAWWIGNQVRVAGPLPTGQPRLTDRRKQPDNQEDGERIIQRLKENGSESVRDLKRSLTKRPKGYWEQRLCELIVAGKVTIIPQGKSEMVNLVTKSAGDPAPVGSVGDVGGSNGASML